MLFGLARPHYFAQQVSFSNKISAFYEMAEQIMSRLVLRSGYSITYLKLMLYPMKETLSRRCPETYLTICTPKIIYSQSRKGLHFTAIHSPVVVVAGTEIFSDLILWKKLEMKKGMKRNYF